MFVEQPKAMSTERAFLKAVSVMIFLGVSCFSIRLTICIPAFLASLIRSDITAGIVPLPGNPMPIASVKQFMEFAVNMPAQEPQVGQAAFSIEASRLSVILPERTAPTASKTVIRSIFRKPVFSGCSPASIGPPLIIIVGRSRRAVAISIPGTILSQFVTITNASNACAVAMTSIESAISSRLAREYFIPVWFMAMPSQTPIVPNSTGVPPAM